MKGEGSDRPPIGGSRREISHLGPVADAFPAALSINAEAINRGNDAIDFSPLLSHRYLFPFPAPGIALRFGSITLP